jgi:chemotaxis protein MotA
MITLPLGALFMLGVIAYSMTGLDISHYLNYHSIVIVILGTFAVMVISNPSSSLKLLFKAVFSLLKKEKKSRSHHEELLKLAKDKATINNSQDPLILYAQQLWEQGLEKELVEHLLEQRYLELSMEKDEPVNILRNLSKYPPAMGMLGTVMGMVSLFATLSGDNKSQVGINLAIAMTATFYGLLLANTVITPLSDRLHVQSLEWKKRNEVTLNILLLINEEEPYEIIQGYLTFGQKAA